VSQPAFDPSVFESLRASVSDDAAFLAGLIADYLEDAQDHIETMRRAVDQNDANQLERTAHSLKSTSETVGAMALAETCRTVEALAHDGQVDDAAQHVQAAADQFDGVEGTLRDHQAALEAED